MEMEDNQNTDEDMNCIQNCFNDFSSKFSNFLDCCKNAVLIRCNTSEKMMKHVAKIALYILFNLFLSGIDTGTDIWAAKIHFQ